MVIFQTPNLLDYLEWKAPQTMANKSDLPVFIK